MVASQSLPREQRNNGGDAIHPKTFAGEEFTPTVTARPTPGFRVTPCTTTTMNGDDLQKRLKIEILDFLYICTRCNRSTLESTGLQHLIVQVVYIITTTFHFLMQSVSNWALNSCLFERLEMEDVACTLHVDFPMLHVSWSSQAASEQSVNESKLYFPAHMRH